MSNNNENDPSNPSSRLSSKARLAYFLTGGTRRRRPSTMTGLLKLGHERVDVKKGHKAWDAAREEDLDRHQGRWGGSVLAGRLEEASGVGPRPRGMALVRWYRESNRGGDGGGDGEEVVAAVVSAKEQQAEQREQPPEDDIYGVSDEEQQRRRVRGGKGNGEGHDGAGGEANPQQQQSGESNDGQQGKHQGND